MKVYYFKHITNYNILEKVYQIETSLILGDEDIDFYSWDRKTIHENVKALEEARYTYAKHMKVLEEKYITDQIQLTDEEVVKLEKGMRRHMIEHILAD